MQSYSIIGSRKALRYGPPPVKARAEVAAPPVVDMSPLLPHQTPPEGAWRGWLLMAGRGAGKTYAGARWLLDSPAGRRRIIGPTYADARDVCAEGESGIVPMARARGLLDAYNRSLGEIRLTNGAHIKLFSADEPDRLRGPQSGADWYDELAAWRYAEATLDMALMGLRLGDDPRYVVTTTPRPTAVVRRLLSDPHVRTTRASTFDNAHLPDAFKTVIVARYEGTRLGRQELNAELLEDTPGALWTRGQLDGLRVVRAPELIRVVTAIDPSATAGGDEAGIVTAGIGMCDCQGEPALHGFVLSDRSAQASPQVWAREAVADYHLFGADALIAEDNNGGEMVAVTISTVEDAPPVKRIHASRGKAARAEPIAMLYEQGRVHHVGAFAKLEDELCSWVPGMASPNRLDALVWALTELMIGGGGWLLA